MTAVSSSPRISTDLTWLLTSMNCSTESSPIRPLPKVFRPAMKSMTTATTMTRMRRKLRGRLPLPSSLRGVSPSKSTGPFILSDNARALPLLFEMRHDPAREAVEGLAPRRLEALGAGRGVGHPLRALVAALAAVGARDRDLQAHHQGAHEELVGL